MMRLEGVEVVWGGRTCDVVGEAQDHEDIVHDAHVLAVRGNSDQQPQHGNLRHCVGEAGQDVGRKGVFLFNQLLLVADFPIPKTDVTYHSRRSCKHRQTDIPTMSTKDALRRNTI